LDFLATVVFFVMFCTTLRTATSAISESFC
jgi:hypothetical protein